MRIELFRKEYTCIDIPFFRYLRVGKEAQLVIGHRGIDFEKYCLFCAKQHDGRWGKIGFVKLDEVNEKFKSESWINRYIGNGLFRDSNSCDIYYDFCQTHLGQMDKLYLDRAYGR